MTIKIPDDLALDLQRVAATQKRSVEQLAVERLRPLVDRRSSPEFLLQALRALPHSSIAAMDDLDASIAAGRLPIRVHGEFDK